MAGTERLKDFPPKATPLSSDIIYGADSSNGFSEVQFTVAELQGSFGAALTSISNLTTSGNQTIYTTAPNTYAVTALTPFARTILDDLDAPSVVATLGIVPGINTQPYSAALTSIAGLTTAADQMIYATASNVYNTTSLTAFGRTLIASPDAATIQSSLNLVSGINIQAYDAGLQSIAGLTTGPDQFIYTSGADVYNVGSFTPLARSLVAGTTQATMQTTLGLVPGTNIEPYSPALSSIAALTTSINQMLFTTAPDVYATTSLTVFSKGLLGLTTPAQYTTAIAALPLTGGIISGAIRYSTFPFSGDELVNKNYVDAVASGGKTPAVAATTANLSGFVYNNGSSGLGATLTAGGNGAFTTDGVTPMVSDRIFVPFQTNQFENGMYVVTQTGDASNPAVLTRSTDYDNVTEIHQGDRFTVLGGTLYSTTDWLETAVVATIGTDPITFTQFGTAYLAKANNLSDVANPATTRTNLGLAIGTNVQAYDAALQSISALTTAADQMIYTTALDTYTTTSLTAFGRTLVGSANAGAAQTSLALVPGTNVQTYNANLTTVAAPVASATLVSSGAGAASWSTAMANGQIVIGSTGTKPVVANLTAGANITITNGAGTITISSTASGSAGQSDIFMLMGA